MPRYLPNLALFGAIFLSLVNIIAAGFALAPAVGWITGMSLPVWLVAPIGFLALGYLVHSWINSMMSNRAGLILYVVNILVAPFGYGLLGLHYALGLALAIAPMPFYYGIKRLSP